MIGRGFTDLSRLVKTGWFVSQDDLHLRQASTINRTLDSRRARITRSSVLQDGHRVDDGRSKGRAMVVIGVPLRRNGHSLPQERHVCGVFFVFFRRTRGCRGAPGLEE